MAMKVRDDDVATPNEVDNDSVNAASDAMTAVNDALEHSCEAFHLNFTQPNRFTITAELNSIQCFGDIATHSTTPRARLTLLSGKISLQHKMFAFCLFIIRRLKGGGLE